jgi:MOSC domain-containing protein YiiM
MGEVSMKDPGKVVGVCVSQRRADRKKNVGEGLLQKGLGLAGDSHAGTEKEVSLLAIENIQKLSKETGISAGPGCFAENVTTEGIDLTSLPIGRNIAEFIRQVKAFQHVRATGEVMPSGWQPGKPTLKPGPDLVGKV